VAADQGADNQDLLRARHEKTAHGAYLQRIPKLDQQSYQDFSNIFIAIFYIKSFGIVASTMAGGAGCIDTGQEEQLNHNKAFAFVSQRPLATLKKRTM
jgi:hypothetical protein